MITNDEQLRQAQDYLRAMEEALVELKAELAERNPERFKISSQSYINEIRRTRAEIDAYLGIPVAVGTE